ncbi:hypothetical protein GC163_13870 [bacterium]|nr:hypothetical protein [bacterium]
MLFGVRNLTVCALVMAGVLSLIGCGKARNEAVSTDGDSSVTTESPDDTAAAESGSNARGLRVRPNAKDFVGRWGLVITQPIPDEKGQPSFRDICLALLEFQKGESGETTGTVVAVMPKFPDLKATETKVEQNKLQVQFSFNGQPGDYQGTLMDGVVRGSLDLPGMGMMTAMLRPTEETTFEGWDYMPLASGLDRFQDAIQSKEQPASIIEAAKDMRGSALSMHAYDGIFARLNQFPNVSADQLKQIYADCLDCANLWGQRVVDQSKLRAAASVTFTRRHPELALEWIAALDSLGEPLKSEMADTVKQLRDQAHVDIAMRNLKTDDAAQKAQAYEELKGLFATQRYNPEILEALGVYAAGHDDKEAAKSYFAEIVAMPMLEQMLAEMHSGQPPGDPTPRERLLNIWEEEKGSVEGFDEFIDATYHQQIEKLFEKARSSASELVPEEERKRTVLVELFTGIGCPPCVGADLALAALAETYPSSNVIVLQYHQHIPAPDPLTNQDSEDRFAYYEGSGTPTVILDGVVSPEGGVGGITHHTEGIYSKVRALVDARMKMAAGGKLELDARVENGTLHVTASATDFDESLLPKLRLRLALVDNDIHLRAPNGIREHHNVVREMPGGAKGSGARNGKLEYSLSMPLSEVEEHLQEYLKQFESGRNVQFTTKPTQLGALSLVGWLQNDATREILQSQIIPVTGTTALPATAAPSDQAQPVDDKPVSATEAANAK